MAVGGGMHSHKIAEAIVELIWEDRKYHAGLLRAKRALDTFTASAQASFNVFNNSSVGGLRSQISALTAGYSQLASSLQGVAAQARRMNASLAATKANMPHMGGSGGSSAGGMGWIGKAMLLPFQMAGNVITGTLGVATRVISTFVNMAGGMITHVLSGVGSLVGMAGIVGGAAAIWKTGSEAVNFESRVATLKRITGASKEATQVLTSAIKGAAGSMPVGLSDLFGITEVGARMGVDQGSLPMFTRDIGKLDVALKGSGLSIEDATERIGSMISVFGKGHEDALRFGSALVKLDQTSVASARDILDVTSRMNGAAAMFGMTPAKTLALATALRQAKVPVETAGTAMGQLFMRMASKRDMPAFAALSGMKQKGFQELLLKDPLAVVERIAKSLSKMNAIQGSQALDKLHLDGQRVRGTLVQLARVWPLLNQYVADAEEQWRSMSEIESQYNIVSETAASQLTVMVNNVKLLAAEVGTAALPMIKGLASGIKNLAIDIREFAVKSADQMREWGKGVGDAFEMVGLAMRNKDLLWKYLQVVVIEKLEQTWFLIKDFFDQTGASIGDYALEVGKWIANRLGSGMIAGLGYILPSVLKVMGGFLPELVAYAGRVMNAMSQALFTGGNAKESISKVSKEATGDLDNIIQTMMEGVDRIREQSDKPFPKFKGSFDLQNAMSRMPDRGREKFQIRDQINIAIAQQKAEREDIFENDKARRQAIADLKAPRQMADVAKIRHDMLAGTRFGLARAESGNLLPAERQRLRTLVEVEQFTLDKQRQKKIEEANRNFPDLQREARLKEIDEELKMTPAQRAAAAARKMFHSGHAKTALQRMRLKKYMEFGDRDRIAQLQTEREAIKQASVASDEAKAKAKAEEEQRKAEATAKLTSKPIVQAVEKTTQAVVDLKAALRFNTLF